MRPDVYEDLPAAADVATAAEVLGVSEDLVRRMIKRGELGHVRLGRLIRVPRHRLIQFLESADSRGGVA